MNTNKSGFVEALKSFSGTQKLFILCAMAYGFFISLEYGITRPAGNCVFLSLFGAGAFPYVWIATVPLNLLVVHSYNRLLPKWGCLKTFVVIAMMIMGLNTLCSFYITYAPALSFLQYIWKDIYILLMYKQLWALINSEFRSGQAKFLYGMIFGVGGTGSFIGSLVPGFLAVRLGSLNLFLFTAPIYFLLIFIYKRLLFYSSNNPYEENSDAQTCGRAGFRLIGKSGLLVLVLLVVLGMQSSSAFIDFNYNTFLEKAIPNMDLRTQYTGRIMGLTNLVSTVLQFFAGMILIHFLGLKRAHLFVPLVLLLNVGLFIVFPTFGMISFAFCLVKVLDYAFFGVVREMLYIPLSRDEKFLAKAVIDVFAYRSAKALVSFLLLFAGFFGIISCQLISWMSLFVLIAWAMSILLMFQHYERRAVLI